METLLGLARVDGVGEANGYHNPGLRMPAGPPPTTQQRAVVVSIISGFPEG
jgi:hypothetical protein